MTIYTATVTFETLEPLDEDVISAAIDSAVGYDIGGVVHLLHVQEEAEDFVVKHDEHVLAMLEREGKEMTQTKETDR